MIFTLYHRELHSDRNFEYNNFTTTVTGLRAGQPGFDSRQVHRFFSPRHCFQIGSVAHTASCPMGSGGSYPGGKAAGARTWPLTTI